MDSNESVLKQTSKVALAALGTLVILAAVFYKERILFADAAYILFNIVNYNSFAIQAHRYGSFITQLVPYLGQKLNLPLKTLIIGYSISFNLFYISVAFLVYRCRQFALVTLMGLYYFLLISESFFWTNNEIHQAIAWMFLLFGVTLFLGHKKKNILLTLATFTLLSFLTIFTHYVVIIPTIFIFVYLILEKKNWPFSRNISILFSCIFALIIAIKFIGANEPSYDNEHLYGLTHVSLKDIIHSFSTPVIKIFLYRCLINYWLAVILFIISIVTLIKNKEKMLATWTFLSALGYFIVMGLIYGDMDANVLLLHIESEWASISIISSAGFVFAFLPRLKPFIASSFLAVIFIVRLVYICVAIPSFSLRIHVNEQVLDRMREKNISKLALIEEPRLQTINKLYWGLPYETLMISAMNGDKPQRTFFMVNRDNKKTQESVKNNNGFYNAFWIVPSSAFNTEYFNVDTTHYQVITYGEFIK